MAMSRAYELGSGLGHRALVNQGDGKLCLEAFADGLGSFVSEVSGRLENWRRFAWLGFCCSSNGVAPTCIVHERNRIMLHEFIVANREELTKRCREKVATRYVPEATAQGPEHGIPIFIGQLIDTLRGEQAPHGAEPLEITKDIGRRAGKHGGELLRKGFSVDSVVHHYGDLCQSLTELAQERHEPITVEEFHTFNRCLDDAIAEAVTEYGRQRDELTSEAGAQTMNERLGSLAHELRNLLNTAMLSFQAMQSGNVALTGATGAVLSRSLIGLRDLIDRSLADVRMTAGLQVRHEPISIAELVRETQISATMEAKSRGLTLTIGPVDEGWVVDGDRQMLAAAIANLLHNAFKFTRPNGHVALRVRADAKRVLVEVEDECGGLPQGKAEELFEPFQQRSSDRSGLGLGLSISRRGVAAHGGTLRVRNLPGTGCVFTIDLPRQKVATSLDS
jgi:signal transduction histidine kinase